MSKKDGRSNTNGNGNSTAAERGGFHTRDLEARVAAAIEQLVWIVVLSADQDAMIRGRNPVGRKKTTK